VRICQLFWAPRILCLSCRISSKHLDGIYYITRVLIPPLERVFNLVGADVRSWYDEMPKPLRADEAESLTISPRKMRPQSIVAGKLKIDAHFAGSRCLTCNAPTTTRKHATFLDDERVDPG
jgi:DNA polymerase zeta